MATAIVVLGIGFVVDHTHRRDPEPAQPAPCSAEDLFARMSRPAVSGDEATAAIELINTGPACTVGGYVGLSLQVRSEPVAITIRTEAGPAGNIPLANGASVRASIRWAWHANQNLPCPHPDEVTVALPGRGTTAAPWIAGETGTVCGGSISLQPLHA